MTVAELIQELEYLDPNAEVRFASQPSWPFEYDIRSITPEVSTKTSIDPVVYLEEGRQIGYLPEEAKDELMW
jgi:hypothetical protein